MDWRDLDVVREAAEMCRTMWELGWDEANGGNLSVLLTEDERRTLGWCAEGVGEAGLIPDDGLRTLTVPDVPDVLRGRLILVTASGSHFREMTERTDELLGILALPVVGNEAAVVAGLRGSVPSSELAAHLATHAARLETDPAQRVVLHSHPTNVLAFTHAGPDTPREVTLALWRIITEGVMLFPDGVGFVPWCVCGTQRIADATNEQMRTRRIVIWQYHGVLACGDSLRGALGLLECVDKCCHVWLAARAAGTPRPGISDEGLIAVCERFGLTPREGHLSV